MSNFRLFSSLPIHGMFLTALLGFSEGWWLLESTGTPDRLSLLYSVVLYGFIGAVIGFGAQVVCSIIGRFAKEKMNKLSSYTLSLAGFCSLFPVASFVGFYQIRKVVYAEKMPPLSVLLMLEGAIIGICLLLLIPQVRSLWNPSKSLAAWGVLFLTGGGLWATQNTSQDAFTQKISRPSAPEGTSNVLFLLVDTLRADHVGAYNEMDIYTPNMDMLAKEGLLFEQSYAQASWTRPSGMSIFTSRIPSGHGTQTKAAAAPEEAVLFTEVLHDAGVRTAGLANNINLTATFNLDQGYDAFLYTEPDYPLYGSESVFGLTLYKVLEKVLARLGSDSNRSVYSYYQPADTLFSHAKGFLKNNGSNPWMLYLHLMEPHDPYFEHPILKGGEQEYSGVAYGRKEHEHPDPSKTAEIKDLYKQEVEFLDRKLGEFFQYLKEQNLYENTWIVLVSDHGEEFHEHGGFWHGTTLYDEVLRVPLLIKTPVSGPKNLRVPWQVRGIDIAPTITAALNIAADSSWEGQNLLSEAALLALKAPDQVGSDCVSSREHPLDRIVVAENNFEGNVLSSLRMRGFKYITANEDNNRNLKAEELYDITSDTVEQKNIAGQKNPICEQSTEDHQKLLKAVLGETINASLQTAVNASGVELDEATIQKMKALGYMTDE